MQQLVRGSTGQGWVAAVAATWLGAVLLMLSCTTWTCVPAVAYPLTTARKTNLIYIYDQGEWQKIMNASRTKRDPREIMDHSMNNGAGTVVNVSAGEYHTDQYQLFLNIFSRALKDPRRTHDPAKATTFIVPYDIATDAAFYKKCARSDGVCYDFRKCPLAPTVSELLKVRTRLRRPDETGGKGREWDASHGAWLSR